MKNYLLYHDYCADGYGAAWAFQKKFGKELEYIGVSHGKPPPPLPELNKLFIVDFSYSREILLELKEQAQEVLILDHHLSAKSALEDLDFAKFDMTKSGAVLAWEYCFPNTEIPLILKYVQDRDLWKFELPFSKEISSLMRATVDFDFTQWDHFSHLLETDFTNQTKIGSVILKNNSRLINGMANKCQIMKFEGFQVGVVNTPVFHSEVCHAILNSKSEAQFAVSWHVDSSGKIKCDLRSRGDIDVSKIASSFGGGGHKSAAGCYLSLDFLKQTFLLG